MPWREWLAQYASWTTRHPFGDHHVEAWEWFEALTPGADPDALIECWSRGHGKSTTLELGIARVGVKATRRFALYVSCDQEAANRHVQACATMMERVGIDRAVNKFGFSKGWRANMLRTANGFNVLAFGLDAGARGVKLDDVRPDLIILDDVDELNDTGEAVEKKIRTITQTILPAGSDDCAVCFFQNLIHANSVLARLMSGDADMLRRRNKARPIPAVVDLEYRETEEVAESGLPLYEITGGTPTWPGKTLEVCEAEINRLGLVSFLRECQHDVGVGGRYFDTWKSAKDGKPTIHEVLSSDVEIRDHWHAEGGYDWGRSSPAAFGLNVMDERGNVITVDEWYGAGRSNDDQATEIIRVLERNGYKKEQVTIFADPSIFPPDKEAKRVGRYTVEDFWDRGLRFVPANNDRINGWNRVKEYIDSRDTYEDPARGETVTVPGLRVLMDKCPNLVRTVALMVKDKRRPEDLDTTLEDHAVDGMWRYGIQRPRASRPDPDKPREKKPRPFRDDLMGGEKKRRL